MRYYLTTVFFLVLSGLAIAESGITVSEKRLDNGNSEIVVDNTISKVKKTYKINLSEHHHPATSEDDPVVRKIKALKYGAFLCYNSNQYSGTEFCSSKNPVNDFDPANLDIKQWVRTIKDAGMTHAVLTVKHTGDFLLWDSNTSEIKSTNSACKKDVVKEYVTQCRKAGIVPGIYYCLWGGDWNPNLNARAIILAQLHELATQYGAIDYFWLDMPHHTGWLTKNLSLQEIYDSLKNINPDSIVMFNNGIQDGSVIKAFPTDMINGEMCSPPAAGHNPWRTVNGKKYYIPFEYEPCSQKRKSHDQLAGWDFPYASWFTYGSGKGFMESETFTAEFLYTRIHKAYDRGASNVLLSCAPDHTGSFRQTDIIELVKLGKMLKSVSNANAQPHVRLPLTHKNPASNPADQGPHGMAVQRVRDNGQVIEVQTTGAELIFNKANNTIDCYQRIPIKRKVATVSGISLKGLRLETHTSNECKLAIGPGKSSSINIALDSMITLPLAAEQKVTITGLYKPEHIGLEDSHFLLPDQQGGVAFYLLGQAECIAPSQWDNVWTVSYSAKDSAKLLLSVFPPRQFDWNQSYETIVHSFSSNNPYPSDEQILEWSKYGSILALHSYIWTGGKGEKGYGIVMDDSWAVAKYIPKSEKELVRVVDKAHSLNMKVIPYMSPYYFLGGDTDDFVSAVDETMKKYNFDGVYFDGIRNDIMQAYDVTRKVKRTIGQDGILYIHSTISPLKKIYCPFIDCYADYLLRGEHRKMTQASARWFISGYNISNSIGTLCYDTHRPTKKEIDMLLSVNARLPFWVDDGTWAKKKYFLNEEEKQLIIDEYLKKIKEQSKTVRSLRDIKVVDTIEK